MGGAAPWLLASAISLAGCLNIPPPPGSGDGRTPDAAPPDAEPCLPGDGDCDGWPAVSPLNPLANDCNDGEPSINPGELDDPSDRIDEDCYLGPSDGSGAIPGTGFANGRLFTSDLDLQFNTDTGMPSSMRLSGVESLHTEGTVCTIGTEEGLGISLYPTFAAHVRSDPMIDGSVTVEREGPAVTTVLVAWAVQIPQGGSVSCDEAVSLTANVRFHAMPGGRIYRDDTITVGLDDRQMPVTMCEGCAASLTAPIFASYTSLDPTLDLVQYNDDPTPEPFLDFILVPANQVMPPLDSHRFCLSSSASGDHRKLGLGWHVGTGGATGFRFKSTASPSTSLVYDFRRSTDIDELTYQASTAMFGQTTSGNCSSEMWDQLDEFVNPANSSEITFDYVRGLYVPQDPIADNALVFSLLGDLERGFGVRVEGFGASGLTVWRDGMRLEVSIDYLIQRDADGAYIVWFPYAPAGEPIVIAGPGGEPPPPP